MVERPSVPAGLDWLEVDLLLAMENSSATTPMPRRLALAGFPPESSFAEYIG